LFRTPFRSTFRGRFLVSDYADIYIVAEGEGSKAVHRGAEAVVIIEPEFLRELTPAIVLVTAEADGEKTSEHLYFIEEPRLDIKEITATHVTVKSPEASYTAKGSLMRKGSTGG